MIDLRLGDCLDVMKTLPDNSVETCITDPPYELSFMGKKWDATGIAFKPETWAAVLRVLKPGAMLMAFGGTRTHHRMMVAIEDAGWEIRDCMMWIFGSGFPKSLDISKAIDKAAGAEREVVGIGRQGKTAHGNGRHIEQGYRPHNSSNPNFEITGTPATDAARTWDGYGTALKPAWEPIVLAMKSLDGTFAENAQKWGVAGLNIDGGRIEGSYKWRASDSHEFNNSSFASGSFGDGPHPGGRWPANLLLDEEAAAMLDVQSGEQKSGVAGVRSFQSKSMFKSGGRNMEAPAGYGDTGGASRFFYTAKASRSERNDGLESGRNDHPTVKPLALMSYLCTLTRTPSGGIVLDPFMGSGSTGVACAKLNRSFIGCELNPEYFEIAKKRIAEAQMQYSMTLVQTQPVKVLA